MPAPRERTALVVTPDGGATLTQLPGAPAARFAAITKAVGGFVEARRLTDGVAYLGEEAKQQGRPANPRATALMRRLGFPFRPGDFTVGTVVFLGFDGADADVTAGMLAEARRVGLTWTEATSA